VAARAFPCYRQLSFRRRRGTVGPPDDVPDDKGSADRWMVGGILAGVICRAVRIPWMR
jgi:hypothetical protein